MLIDSKSRGLDTSGNGSIPLLDVVFVIELHLIQENLVGDLWWSTLVQLFQPESIFSKEIVVIPRTRVEFREFSMAHHASSESIQRASEELTFEYRNRRPIP